MRTPELAAAFHATTYRVLTHEGSFDLHVGEVNPAFACWLKKQAISCWGIITACNPAGMLTPDDNARRTMALQERINKNCWRHVSACNCADARDWPDEPGFCVLDVAREALGALAFEFEQMAIVCGERDGVGRLVWLDGTNPLQ